MNIRKYIIVVTLTHFFSAYAAGSATGADSVGLYDVYELKFATSTSSNNPFDSYLLKAEVTDPDGKAFTIDGFFDGDGKVGQSGNIWKVRICPYKTGRWSWRTVPGDNGKDNFGHAKGEFICFDKGAKGGLTAQGKYFKYQSGPFVYLQGNFLDFSNGLESTHVYMGDGITDDDRKAILKRQVDFHHANKVNLYLANRGDYKGKKVTPWLKLSGDVDLSRMDLKRWRFFEECIAEFGENGLFAEIWFFADDSQFGKLSTKEKEILFRYGMARLSSLRSTLFIICLEWEEGWSKAQVNEAGRYVQAHNPWSRLVSVHGLPVVDNKWEMSIKWFVNLFKERKYWAFAGERWPAFIASQVGNRSTVQEVNHLAVKIHAEQAIPHLSEEFGILKSDSDNQLRAKMWANFCGGAAGGGTGSDIASFMNFLEKSDIPFQRMKASNALLKRDGDNRFCLAAKGEHYVVYTEKGKVNLRVDGSDMVAYWYNVREKSPPLQPAGALNAEGQNEFEPPDLNNDWVLWVTKKNNLGWTERGVSN